MLVPNLGHFRGRVFRRNPPLSDLRTLSKDLGWTSTRENGYRESYGFFRPNGLRWDGYIVENNYQSFRFYILKPPIRLLRRTEWAGCFHSIGDSGWYRITFKPWSIPKDVDGGIAAVNKVLRNIFRRR